MIHWDLVDAMLEPYCKANGPGCALGVFKDGRAIYMKGYGSKRVGERDPVVDTKFCPFSQGPFRSPRVLRISPNLSSVLKIASRVSSRLLQPGLAQAAEIASHAS